jgi:excinuclease ABC subunit B
MDPKKFIMNSKFDPAGDQPTAIKHLVKGIKDGKRFQTLLGATGTGKTFTMAKVVEAIQRPTLVLAHNKTLAAQLCSEFQEFFPDNAVSYFVSYYDYYQPEAYMPATDTYIEKDASINEEIDKFRHAATANLLTRKDVLIVASVSCIYGLGSVDDYSTLARHVKVGDVIVRDKFLRQLSDLQYRRSAMDFKNGMFHVLGDVVEVFPPDRDTVFRFEFFGDEIEAIAEVETFTGEVIRNLEEVKIFPAKHAVTTEEKIKKSVEKIKEDLDKRYQFLNSQGRMLEAERIKTRTEYDLEILQETGYCSGIENYTRYLSGKPAGERPSTLLDYLPDDFLLLIDESHISVPQIGAMHNGNYSRKQTLVEHGFRLPSAHDNRPLKFDEFEEYMNHTVFVSATPGKYELEHTKKEDIAEQVVRPTGLLDPIIEVRPTDGQIQDLLEEINKRVEVGERVLITTLTKKSSEDLTDFLADADIRVKYLHSDIDTIERIEILRDLRLGKFDVLVGINLLREGLDLPEVSLVAILDADKRGFLRSASALIQTVGRCARNAKGFVIMYADEITEAMDTCITETKRRRAKQEAYNKKHGIVPKTIIKDVRDISHFGGAKKEDAEIPFDKIPKDEAKRLIKILEQKMEFASQNLEFEKAMDFRDQIDKLKERFVI